jgi:S1-C subfamily serine protease
MSRLVGCLLGALVLAAASDARSQEVPDDLRPFVKLGFEGTRLLYKNPKMEAGTVKDPGVLVGSPERTIVTVGSGTVVTSDGLILTNHHVYVFVTKISDDTKEVPGHLSRVTPICCEMLVFENDPARRFKPPEPKYRARLVASSEALDVAVLKITKDLKGNLVTRQDFAAVPLGNPYGIPLGGMLRILGYPVKGGESLMPSHTEFAGYTTNAPLALDGSFKTVGTIAGGNSGGSTLYNGKLVGIPTRASQKEELGAEFGYIHPVSWAARPLAIAALRDRQRIPEIDPRWLESSENTDITRTRVFLGGKVVSLLTQQGVAGADVLFHRVDRTLDQIRELYRQVVGIARALQVRKKLDEGLTPEGAAQALQLPVEQVRQLMNVQMDESRWSDDLRRLNRGEFFFHLYRTAETPASDGFFLVAVPRGQPLRLVVSAKGFIDGSRDYLPQHGVFADVGAVAMLAVPSGPTIPWMFKLPSLPQQGR